MREDEGLKREIGVWGLASNSINIIIGAGIFILPALVAERLGSGGIWPYIICGILMILIMLCFAEVGTKITLTGGAYSYIEIAFGKYAGFLTTNIFIFGAAVMANAAVANGLADTISYFLPFFKMQWIRILFFALIFGGLAYYNVRGIKKAITIVKFNTIIKLVPLLMIALFGWFFISSSGTTITSANPLNDTGEMSLILLFAFVGAETALNVSGEIKDPVRTIPRGIMLSVFIVVILYIMIQLTVFGILGDSIVKFRDAPLAEAASIMIGSAGTLIVLIGASFSMFGNISGMVLNMPRVLYAAARDRVIIPKALAKIHPDFLTPHISIISYAAMGFIFASIGEFKQLAILSSASYLLIYFGVVLALIKFRLTKPGEEQGLYRIPGGYSVPVIAALAIIWVLSNLPVNEIKGMLIFIFLLTVIYLIFQVFGRKVKKM
jgi:APA family basic amino acid/polyamine antiporter